MLRVEDADRVRTLTIDNPGRRNAVGTDEFTELATIFEEFENSDPRVLVIRGEGEDFCTGLDLASTGSFEGGIAATTRMIERVSRAAVTLFRTTKPTIAAVDGYAVGAGMNLALCCDIVVASDRARFSEVFVRRGLTVDFGGTWLLPRLVGMARAKALALTGRVFGAEEAFEYGMLAEVVAPDDLHGRARDLALELAAGAPLAQRFIKGGLNRSLEMSFEEAAEYEAQSQALLLTSEDAMEGFVSFLEKRDAEFEGK